MISHIFSCILLLSNHMIFLVQFGTNVKCKFFQRPKIARPCRAREFCQSLKKFTSAYIFQIALEIMRLPIQILQVYIH